MKSLPLLFLGVFFTLAFSWTGIVLVNHLTLGDLEQMSAEWATDPDGNPLVGQAAEGEPLYPQLESGIARQGKQVYIEMGCMYCHTQQVRRQGYGSDFERGWGDRQSVARDYILQERVLLGTMRTGPDLKAVGQRLPDPNWHHIHLYEPESVSPGSIMPPFRFLYEKREIDETGPSENAIQLPPEFAPEEGYEIVPTRRAEALVAYLLSLRLDYDLPEMKRN